MAKRTVLIWAAALVWAVAAGAAEAPRNWGFGYDDGLVLRRALGPWELALGAGPSDYLQDRYTSGYGQSLPDSLQGALRDENHSRRESGFVRVGVSRGLADYGDFGLRGLVRLRYQWSDQSWIDRYYYTYQADWRESREERFSDTWSLSWGAELVWRPLPFLSVAADFGLVYSWTAVSSDVQTREPGEVDWEYEHEDTRSRSFSSFYPYDLTAGLAVTAWF